MSPFNNSPMSIDLTCNKAQPLFQRIRWVNVVVNVVVPCLGIAGALFVSLSPCTFYWSLACYLLSGMGITAGYHRHFAHRAYKVPQVIRFVLMVMGTMALQGSVRWWSGLHRDHHRYTDTDRDPYSIKKGFWFAHIGWMLVSSSRKSWQERADITDLDQEPMLRWQHRHYWWFGPVVAVVFPTMFTGLLWGDWFGGFFYASCLRLGAVQQATFCVNSVAHWFGEHSFDDNLSPRDHAFTAFLTFGEGYHNFHHQFPNDYRNGINAWDWDPTKWFIKSLNRLGLAYELCVFPSNVIALGRVSMLEKELKVAKAKAQETTTEENLLYTSNSLSKGNGKACSGCS